MVSTHVLLQWPSLLLGTYCVNLCTTHNYFLHFRVLYLIYNNLLLYHDIIIYQTKTDVRFHVIYVCICACPVKCQNYSIGKLRFALYSFKGYNIITITMYQLQFNVGYTFDRHHHQHHHRTLKNGQWLKRIWCNFCSLFCCKYSLLSFMYLVRSALV